jgi:hypothetical protein
MCVEGKRTASEIQRDLRTRYTIHDPNFKERAYLHSMWKKVCNFMLTSVQRKAMMVEEQAVFRPNPIFQP